MTTADACAAIIIALLADNSMEVNDVKDELPLVPPRKRKMKSMKSKIEKKAKRKTTSYDNIPRELVFKSRREFQTLHRMDEDTFEELLEMVTPLIQKQDTIMRESLCARQRLSATLRYLVSGETFEDLKVKLCIAAQTLGKLVIETCEALIEVLKHEIKKPNSEYAWKEEADKFYHEWNFPNCLGVIGAKHIEIKKPPNSGNTYSNHNKSFSVILMAIVNANYEFIMVDVDCRSREPEAELFLNTKFCNDLAEGNLNIPEQEKIPNICLEFPYVFVADEGFPLMPNLMIPYPDQQLTTEQDIFNYRLSRARRVIDNVFGVMSSRFEVLLSRINLSPEKSVKIILACCYLHNYLKKADNGIYLNHGFDFEDTDNAAFTAGDWRDNSKQLLPIESSYLNIGTIEAEDIRDEYCSYFNTDGTVPWQDEFRPI